MKFIDLGLGSTPGQELWVSGCSAGAIGATAMADSWLPRLMALGMKHTVKVWTMLDNMPIVSPPGVGGPFGKSIAEMAGTLVDFLYKEERGVSPSPFVNKACAAYWTPKEEGVGQCIWPGEGIKWIKIPNIVLNQLWDNFVTAKTYGFMHPVSAVQYNTGVSIVNITKAVFKPTPVQNFWAISCGDHCMSENPNFWRMMPITGNRAISARDMVKETRDGALGKPGLLGNVVTDACHAYNCGCIGQSSSMTKLAGNTLYHMMLAKIGMNPLSMAPATIAYTTAIASGQTNGLQILTP